MHGRFINEDPIKSKDNWYVYCSNNPFKYADPLGLSDTGLIPDWLEEKGGDIRNKNKEFIDKFTKATQDGSIDSLLQATSFVKDSDGVIHVEENCWQHGAGYNDTYDAVFDAATSMDRNKITAEVNGEEYAIWMWKGDYINFGAGAEMGIYKRDASKSRYKIPGTDYELAHWSAVGKDERVSMDLKLQYNGNTIYDYSPSEKQWWITGFDPNTQGVDKDDLTVKGRIDLSSNKEMYEAFKYKYGNGNELCFNDDEHTIYYTW